MDSDHSIHNCFGFHAKHLLEECLEIIRKEK